MLLNFFVTILTFTSSVAAFGSGSKPSAHICLVVRSMYCRDGISVCFIRVGSLGCWSGDFKSFVIALILSWLGLSVFQISRGGTGSSVGFSGRTFARQTAGQMPTMAHRLCLEFFDCRIIETVQFGVDFGLRWDVLNFRSGCLSRPPR